MNNGGPGVLVGADARNVTIRGNRINTNLGVGIDLVPTGGPSNGDGSTPNVASGPGAGGNDLLFFPELASAGPSGEGTTVAGSLTVPSSADGEFVVDFYSVSRCDNAPPPGGFGEGAMPIGSIAMPAASGPTTVPFTADGLGMVSVGSFVTATATDGFGTGNTSEFSACAQVADTGPESADLTVSVQNAPNPVTGGYDLGSTATVTNQGPGDATGVSLTDTLAPGESFVGAGSDPSCSADAGVVTCPLNDLANGDVATVLIVTKTPQVSADTTIHDVFAASAAEDDTPDNSTLDVSTTVRAPSANFVAGYVPVSSSITWLSDATAVEPRRSRRDDGRSDRGVPSASRAADPAVRSSSPNVRAPRRSHAPHRSAVHCVLLRDAARQLREPHRRRASRAATAPRTRSRASSWTTGRSSTGAGARSRSRSSRTRAARRASCPRCGGWTHAGPPCVSSIGRSFQWWNHYAFGDLRTVVRFTNGGTFGRGR